MQQSLLMDDTIRWLLQDADPSLEYQVRRDLLNQPDEETEALRRKIPSSGWAKALLDERKGSGHWGGGYRKGEIAQALGEAVEFILRHRLCRSERTGETIRDEFFRFPFPIRWKYDILRCLDLFRKFGLPYDVRMDDALDFIAGAAGRKGRWKAASQPGKTYFVMEKNGSEGKWNTLRALRVLAHYAGAGKMEKRK